MTPKEFEFLVGMIEESSRRAYTLGYEEGKAGKPPREDGFAMSKASRLTLKTNLEKHTKKR